MKETIKNILITNFNISEDLIHYDFRLKDKNNKIHRFDLVLQPNPDFNIIFRIIYAKTKSQADFWINRINYEYDIIQDKSRKSFTFVVISGIAFKNLISEFEQVKDHFRLVPFPGWEKIYNLPSFSRVIKDLDIIEKSLRSKQLSIEKFQ